MRRILLTTATLFALFLVSWLVFTALGVLTPDATERWLRTVSPVAAALAVAGLLAADILLPVPGSIVLSAGGIVLCWPVATAAGCAGLMVLAVPAAYWLGFAVVARRAARPGR